MEVELSVSSWSFQVPDHSLHLISAMLYMPDSLGTAQSGNNPHHWVLEVKLFPLKGKCHYNVLANLLENNF